MKIYLSLILFCITLSVFSQLPSTGLIAYYPLNGEANDASGNNNNGMVIGGVGAAADRFGNNCGAMSFNGVDGYITIPSSASLESPVNAITVAAWFRIEPNPASPDSKWLSLICKGDLPTETNDMPQYRVQLFQNEKMNFSSSSISTAFTKVDPNFMMHPINFSVWNFCAVTYDGKAVEVYLNGSKIWDTIYTTNFVPNKLPLNIAKDVPGKTEFFSGALDDLRIYNRALKLNEIQALYNDKTGSRFEEDVRMAPVANIEKIADANTCSSTVVFSPPIVTTACGTTELKQVNGISSGSQFPVGRSSVTFLASNSYGRKQTSTFDIIVTDKTPPSIVCPADMKVKCPAGSKTIKVNYPSPTYADNCPNVLLTQVSGPQSGSEFSIGVTTISYKASDPSGNTAECSFKVIVESETPVATEWKINCPSDIVVSNNIGKCGANVNYTAPKITGANDIAIKQTAGATSGYFFPVGSTINSFKASDKSGDKQCSFNVKVLDNENPTLEIPHDTVIVIGIAEAGIKFKYDQPTGSDNCRIKEVRLVDGLPSGSFFKMGTTKVTYHAEDDAGNSILRSFYVTIKPLGEAPPQPTIAPVAAITIPTKLPASTGFNDTIDYQHVVPLPEGKGCKFTMFVFDDEDEDGDTVSLIFNDRVIVNQQMIHVITPYSYSQAIKVVVDLDPNKKNILVSKAWNMGAHPPNTCEVDIYEGEVTNNMIVANKDKLVKKLKLNARPGIAAGITLQCRQ